jgi:hypothetical protein
MKEQQNAKRIADVLIKIGPKDDLIKLGVINNISADGSLLSSVDGSVAPVTPVTDDDYRPGGLTWLIKTQDKGYIALGPAR